MCISCSPPSNLVIDSLPSDVRRRWAAHLEEVRLPERLVLHESGDTMGFAYFPTTAVVSIVYVTAEGKSTELAAIGNEGMVGIELLLGGGSMPNRASVVSPGGALRLPAGLLQDEMAGAGPAAHLLLRYILALTAQVAQSAVCNRHHSLAERLCRWLLMSLDRSQGSEIRTTHRQIAFALGVRREGVSEEALRLQSQGLISYWRGHIEVLDRAGLEEQVCECYGVVRNEFDRLLPHTRPTRLPMAYFRGVPITRPHQTWTPLSQ
jgi:CRP-like cAMP-binding protein